MGSSCWRSSPLRSWRLLKKSLSKSTGKMFFLKFYFLSISQLNSSKQNPDRLERVTTNKMLRSPDFNCEKCEANKRSQKIPGTLVQCESCAFNVSQTKSGICLQFQWRSPEGKYIYCSMDLVPTFGIRPMEATKLAKVVNTAMLASPESQPGWFRSVCCCCCLLWLWLCCCCCCKIVIVLGTSKTTSSPTW